MEYFNRLEKDLDKYNFKIKKNENMAAYTTIGIGGAATLFTEVCKTNQLEQAIKLAYAHQVPYFIIGKGSNIIISDLYYLPVIGLI